MFEWQRWSKSISCGVIAIYVLLSIVFGGSPNAPVFLYSWRLFDEWSRADKTFFDISFEISTPDGTVISSALKDPGFLFAKDIDAVKTTNVLLGAFNFDHYDMQQTLGSFKEKCQCQNIRLLKLSGSLSDHLIFKKDLPTEIVREL